VPRKAGIWDRKTGKNVFSSSASASDYFFEELRKILDITKEKFDKQGFGLNFLIDMEISLGFIPETYEEALVFAQGGRHLADVLSKPRVLNAIIKEAFLYGVVQTQTSGERRGLGLSDLWKSDGYGATVGGKKASQLSEDRTAVYNAINDDDSYKVRRKYKKDTQFRGVRRSITLSDLGEAIRDAFTSKIKVSNQRASLPSAQWFAKQSQFQFPSGKGKFRSKFTSAFMLLEFGSGKYAKKGWIRPYTSARATPFKVPSALGGEGQWYSHIRTSRNVHDYLKLAGKSKLTKREKQRLQKHTDKAHLYAGAERPGRLSRGVIFDERGRLSLQRTGRKDFIEATQIRFLELLNKRIRKKLGGKKAMLWKDSFLLGLIKYK